MKMKDDRRVTQSLEAKSSSSYSAAKRKHSDLSEEDEEEKVATSKGVKSARGDSSISKKDMINYDDIVSEPALEKIRNIELPDDRVFDDCDEVRSKINALLNTTGMNPSRVSKFLGVTNSSLKTFMEKKGYNIGAGSKVYLYGYEFFEQVRIFRNEEKSLHRLQSEREHPGGYPLVNPSKSHRGSYYRAYAAA